jgi:hypothetical protein
LKHVTVFVTLLEWANFKVRANREYRSVGGQLAYEAKCMSEEMPNFPASICREHTEEHLPKQIRLEGWDGAESLKTVAAFTEQSSTAIAEYIVINGA